MKDLVLAARRALENLGSLEGSCKTMGASTHEGLKKVHELLGPVMGPAVAHLQGAIEELDKDGLTAGPTQQHSMSAQAADAAQLGTEVLKLTGATSRDEALGIMEARQNQVSKLTAQLAKLGVETGRLEATELAKYSKYEPARLIAVLEHSTATTLSAKRPEAEAPPPPAAETADVHQLGAATQTLITDVLSRSGIKLS